MAITRVGASQGTSNVGQTSLGLTRTAGAINNLLIVAFEVANASAVPTISDTQTNTWVPCNPVFHDATNAATLISWYALAKNTTATTVTVASNVAFTFVSMTLDEFTGNATASPLDQVAHSVVGASGTPISPTITPAADNELVWAYCSDSITAVGNIGGSAATKGGDDGSQDWSEFRVLVGGNGVGITAAFTGSGAYDLIAATFKPAVGTTFLAANPPVAQQAVKRANYF